ncbi:transglutaminase-like domain-containing protein [Paenibacillus harenae]|uniref:transglutaminase-like domain-containing protein n=1 Tax=Paenibacillus harenae TaxID=306543 RepID=UPI0004218194|nr:transglutaminase-like domain-containing protein [Paenibacillus harenae]
MRKYLLFVTAFFILFASTNGYAVQASSPEWLDQSNLERGVVSVRYAANAKAKIKLMVAKGNEKYTYNLTSGKKEEFFPLQLGNGEYTITLLENVSGNKYKLIKKETVELDMKDNRAVYLNSVQNIAWTSTSSAIAKAQQLTKGLKTDIEKVKAVHDYIITNINYDEKLAANVRADYIPNIDDTFKSKKAICYGYASLSAAMLRSLDIPAKLVMGSSTYVETYHAWNEVWLDGKWVTIDTTVNAALKKSKKKIELKKDPAKYTADKHY